MPARLLRGLTSLAFLFPYLTGLKLSTLKKLSEAEWQFRIPGIKSFAIKEFSIG
jgi:hypothetical protein